MPSPRSSVCSTDARTRVSHTFIDLMAQLAAERARW